MRSLARGVGLRKVTSLISSRAMALCREAKLSFHHQQSRLQLDTVPEVLQPDVLVRAVLIVVVIDDWNLDRVRSQYVDDHVERDASARGGLQHNRASHATRRRDEVLRGR